MTENDNIEKLFRDSFEDFQAPPPPDVKRQIDKQLRGNSHRFIYWVLGAMLGAGIGVLGFMAYFSSSATDSQAVIHTSSPTAQQAANQSNIQSGNGSASESVSDNTRSVSSPAASASTIADTSTFDNETAAVLPNASKNRVATNAFNRNASVQKAALPEKQGNASKKSFAASSASSKKSKGQTKGRTRLNKSRQSPGKSSATDFAAIHSDNPATNTGSDNQAVKSATNATGQESSETASESTEQKPDSAASTASSSTKSTAADSSKAATTSDTAEKQDKSEPKKSTNSNQPKKWLAQLQPGIGFGSASKAAQDVKGIPGFDLTAGVYRQFGNKLPVRAGLDVSFSSGSFKWSQDSTFNTTVTLDSVVTYQQDTIIYYDTVYYTVTTPHTQSTSYRTAVSQISFGLAAQLDAPLTDKIGFVITPGFRFTQTKFIRQSDGFTTKSGNFQLNLGLDVYYDWKFWRFTIGARYAHAWMKSTQNPFSATGLSQFSPRIGIGIRF